MNAFRIGDKRAVIPKDKRRCLSFPYMVRLDGGRLLVTYRGACTEGSGCSAACLISKDGGETWGPEAEVDDRTAYQVGSYGMGDVVELEDGRVQVCTTRLTRIRRPGWRSARWCGNEPGHASSRMGRSQGDTREMRALAAGPLS